MKKNKQYTKYLTLLVAVMLLSSNMTYARENEFNDGSKISETRGLGENNDDRNDDAKIGNNQELENQIQLKREAYRREFKDLREKYSLIIDDLKTQIEQRKNETKQSKDLEKINKNKQKYTNRGISIDSWTSAVEKIEKIQDKLNEIIKKATTLGIDTTNAETSITNADAKIAQIQTNVTAMMALIAKPVPLADADKKELLILSKKTQALVKDANKSLREALNMLKQAMQDKRKEDKNKEASTNINN
ncbi:MAG: hypothetical protein M3P22_02635 [bacterium]|nr:hypothetical protein [bacterium]